MNRRSNPARILVVDDDPDTVDILSRHLQREGFVAIEALCGTDCLQIARESEVDVILLDLMMPGMDGWDFRSEQLRDPKLARVPVVVVSASGFSYESIRTQFQPAAFVPKPIERTALLGVIRELMRSGPPRQLDATERAGDPEDDGT